MLRKHLISGAIVPGEGLSTRAIALELGVSQISVRDALYRASGHNLLNQPIEALWLQFGPYRRTVYEPEA